MATIEAVGPAFSLDGPPPVAPPHSLLMQEGGVVERDATRVLNGVNVWAYPTGCSFCGSRVRTAPIVSRTVCRASRPDGSTRSWSTRR